MCVAKQLSISLCSSQNRNFLFINGDHKYYGGTKISLASNVGVCANSFAHAFFLADFRLCWRRSRGSYRCVYGHPCCFPFTQVRIRIDDEVLLHTIWYIFARFFTITIRKKAYSVLSSAKKRLSVVHLQVSSAPRSPEGWLSHYYGVLSGLFLFAAGNRHRIFVCDYYSFAYQLLALACSPDCLCAWLMFLCLIVNLKNEWPWYGVLTLPVKHEVSICCRFF